MDLSGIKSLSVAVAAIAICLCSCSRGVTVSVYNPSEKARNAQVVEIDASSITDRLGVDFNVKDSQVTL